MQKKSLDSNLGIQDYNKKLFGKSMQLISSFKKIPISQVSTLYRQEGVRKKYNAIEQKLQNILKILRNFTDTEKPVFNNPIDLASDILEETKLQVEIQFRKAQQQKNTLKVQKSQSAVRKQRPQTRYPNIKIYQNFDEHSHQTYLEEGLFPEIKPCESIQQPSPMTNDYLYVDTAQKLDQAIKEIKMHSQLAVDVEHSAKSYEGFTCLIQMSTREKDYIIDVFPIWDCVPALQQVIGNPNILKIMHGAEMDTKWLQRDFNIHIVNLFDTYRAARVIGTQKFSYAYLLNHYCSVHTNKIYQRADWRQRPLINQMLKYARMDTHYLLTIYDHLRTDIQKQSISMNVSLKDVFYDVQKSSHEVTLANAELFSYSTKEMYMNLMSNFKDKPQQFKAIESIFSQINYVALKEDENFDDLISRNQLDSALSLVKDLTFNQKSKISKQARIQKIVSTLQKSGFQCLSEAVVNIKNSLTSIFCNHKAINIQNKKVPEVPKPQRSQTLIQAPSVLSSQTLFARQKNSELKFTELPYKSFENQKQNDKKVVISFMPIACFLSQKYGIEQVKQEDNVMQQQSDNMEQQINEQANGDIKQEDEAEQQGVIQFKRMNPNVIYTVQQQDPEVASAVKTYQPRKARRQTEYQNRIRNQKGNIFDLLENA